MTALQRFNQNLTAASSLVAMYRELRVSRGLGARGVLAAAHQQLLWLPRSAVVATVSAFDSYVHDVLLQRLPPLLATPGTLPTPLAELIASKLSIKSAQDVKDRLPIFTASNSGTQILNYLVADHFAYQTYQAPDKVVAAYNLLGKPQIFDSVADIWPGPNTTAQHIRRRLSAYVDRRNKIAHEADLDAGQPRPMRPEYAIGCEDFFRSLVTRMQQIAPG